MKSTEELIKEGAQLRLYRQLMGIKQIDMASKLNTNQSNYCNMELGRLNSGGRLDKVTDMFKAWREKEVYRLRTNIEYLKSL